MADQTGLLTDLPDAHVHAMSEPSARRRLLTSRWRQGAWVLLFIAVCGYRSRQIGNDSNWDLLNYHLYNGLSILDGSWLTDVAPANIQSFLNPLLDLPLGIAVRLLGVHRGIIAWSAAAQCLSYFAVWRLAGELFRSAGTRARLVAVTVTLAGSGALSLAFTTFGDWLTAALLCEGVRLLLSSFPPNATHVRRQLLLGGAAIGCATGLKLTAVPFAMAAVLALPLVLRVRDAAAAALGMAAGALVTSGPWMVVMQIRHGSPLFPFYNGVFGAEGAPSTDFSDPRFGASGIQSFWRMPVDLARGTTSYSELPFRDWRYLALLGLAAAWLILHRPRRRGDDSPIVFLGAMLLISYVVWLDVFGIYRYFLFGELLTSMLIVLLLLRLFEGRDVALAVTMVALTIGLAFQSTPDWGRNYAVDSPSLRQLASETDGHLTVIVSADPPLGFLKASLPEDTTIVNIAAFASGSLIPEGRLARQMNSAITDALKTGSLYLITAPGLEVPYAPLDSLTGGNCSPFDAAGRPLEWCSVTSARG